MYNDLYSHQQTHAKMFLFKLHDKKDIAGNHVSAIFFNRFYIATEQK